MEDFKFIFYILLAIGYFIFSNWRKFFKDDPGQPKKFRDENEPPVQRTETPRRPSVPVTSFEDILKELQPKIEQARSEARELVPVPALQQVNIPKKREVLSYEAPVREPISLEKQFPKRRTIERYQTPEAYTIKETRYHKAFDPSILRNPATAREAFILSEIFNRRY